MILSSERTVYLFKTHTLLTCLLALIPFSKSFSQELFPEDSTVATTHTNVWFELAAYGSTADRTPFWLRANQWGTVPLTGQVVSPRAGFEGAQVLTKDSTKNLKWIFNYGAEVVGNISQDAKLLIPQAYASLGYGNLHLTVGRWKQFVGFNDNEVGTGSYMWSGNALPVPKFQVGFEKYTPIFKKFLYFKGFYSDGMLERQRAITSEMKLHNKALFIRLGKPDGKLKLHGGFNHAVQWGGKSPYLTTDGQMPSGLQYYWFVVSGAKPLHRKELDTFDRTNRIGNHVASIDGGLELDLPNVNIMLYRQNLVEDGSLFYLNNIKDGLNGITFRMKGEDKKAFSVKLLTFELLYTKSQGGSETATGTGIRGKDDYFNNGQVRDGWSYFGRGLGTPFITPTSENNWPLYADFFTNNNRVWAAHVGGRGNLGDATWTSKFSFSSNQGTYDQPFPDKVFQFSGIIGISKPTQWLGGSTVQAAVSLDQGKLFDNAFGAMLSIRKNLSL